VRIWFRVCKSWEEEAAADREWHAWFTPEERVDMINGLLRDYDGMKNRPLTPDRDFAGLFASLNQRGVRYVIVGAYAFAFHLRARYTDAIDLFVDPYDELLAHPHVVFRETIHGVTFEEAWATRAAATYEGVPVHYIGLDALKSNKTASGRGYDLADLDYLRQSGK
jgi:hypothetical protein